MALIYRDRVKQKGAGSGTGAFVLGIPVVSYVQFSDASLGSDSFPYAIVNSTQFEVGIGTYVTPGASGSAYGVLSRNLVLSNSENNTSFIDFSSGTSDVFITNASELSVLVSTQPTADTKIIKWTGSNFELIDPVYNSTSLGTSINSSIMYFNAVTTNYEADEDFTFTPGALPELYINGVIQATAKSFKIKHPTKPNMFLVHGCLEGPEHGIYLRGSIKIKYSGTVFIPEYFRALTSGSYSVHISTSSFMPIKVYKEEDCFTFKLFLPTINNVTVDYIVVAGRNDVAFKMEV